MNTRITFSYKKVCTVTLAMVLGHISMTHAAQTQQSPATSFSVYSNLTTLGTGSDISNLNTRLNTLDTNVGTANAALANGTYGLSALNTDLDSILANQGTQGTGALATAANLVKLGNTGDVSNMFALLGYMINTLGTSTSYADPVTIVTAAKGNPALTSTFTVTGGDASAYTDALYGSATTGTPSAPTAASALGKANTAISSAANQTQSNATLAINQLTATQTAWNTLMDSGATITSSYGQAEIQCALTSLSNALQILKSYERV